MKATRSTSGITFAVDDVVPATTPLEEIRAHKALEQMIGGSVESCSDYHSIVVKGVYYQPLLASVYMAYNDHRPLVLTPDGIWITITQGIAHHMAIHGERLRKRFVAHKGKLALTFGFTDWVARSPENPWEQAFASWTAQIREHVGTQMHDVLVCDFSTTGPLERTVSQIVMMDIFERYFHFRAVGICGIPQITLEGSQADWERLREKVGQLRIFDIDWWLDELEPICNQFVRAACGDVDLKHWQSICKLREAYGGHVINGWVCRLFPYIQSFPDGPCREKNPIFETGEGMQTFMAPPGLSKVPITWLDLRDGSRRLMEAIGGFMGVMQNQQTLALRPMLGWAVREAPRMDQVFSKLQEEHSVRAGADLTKEDPRGWTLSLPQEVARFFHLTDGADLFGKGEEAAFRIVPLHQIQPFDWGETEDKRGNSYNHSGRAWHGIVLLNDGSWLAANFDWNRYPPRAKIPKEFDYDIYCPVCHCSPRSVGKPGGNPVVALSFAELMERLLQSDGKWFWREAGFESYGDAEEFTRRTGL